MLDGEVLAFRDDRPLPFSALQQRIGRQKQVAQMVRAVPVVFMAYDILEIARRGHPRRSRSTSAARAARVACSPARRACSAHVAEIVTGADAGRRLAALRADSRARGVEGLMLKRLDSAYGVGRRRGDWWKWKIEPYTIDAVLIYAQPGSGRRASLLTDYTFGVWDAGELVPIAKAYSGLSNEEIAELDAGSAATRANGSARSGTSSRCRSSSSASRASPRRRATAPASPCGFRGCCAGARTRSRRTPTRSIRSANSGERACTSRRQRYMIAGHPMPSLRLVSASILRSWRSLPLPRTLRRSATSTCGSPRPASRDARAARLRRGARTRPRLA